MLKTKLECETFDSFKNRWYADLRKQTKCKLNYKYDPNLLYLFSKYLYNGSALNLYCPKEKNCLLKGYDLNSAYESYLLNEIFPLDNETITTQYDKIAFTEEEVLSKENPNKLYFYHISLTGVDLKDQYQNLNLNDIYVGSALKYNIKHKLYLGWLTNIDFKAFKMLYTYSDCKIYEIIEFPNCGKLEQIKPLIYEAFNTVNTFPRGTIERREMKGLMHKNFYGVMAYGNTFGRSRAEIEYPQRMSNCIIPIFQMSYSRYNMIKRIVKYHPHIVYIDTDGMFMNKDIEFDEPIGVNIGEWKIDHNNVYGKFYRQKGYILYNKDLTIKEQHFSGMDRDMTIEEIDELDTKGIVLLNNVQGGNWSESNEYEFGWL